MDSLELYFWLALCSAGLFGLLLGYVVWEILHRTDPHTREMPPYDVQQEVDRILEKLGKRKP